ncbi:hypothetical protein B0T26DRAFT_676972 [Lasiosphaeria miniovina]|uniref:Uncharacterized protein n=1 Tax=Lasiosphaeria miniovina TaxID=1954250 RepID=A0AA40DR67_9PEZI|nr:uncharacterized protein B0T26DRAFT_676972 [Lasiosphaeria miniovina]KAK0712520.1 hypothetical protein B0T26DRAFT_676972 [Lasiosphaeria miniovina]
MSHIPGSSPRPCSWIRLVKRDEVPKAPTSSVQSVGNTGVNDLTFTPFSGAKRIDSGYEPGPGSSHSTKNPEHIAVYAYDIRDQRKPRVNMTIRIEHHDTWNLTNGIDFIIPLSTSGHERIPTLDKPKAKLSVGIYSEAGVYQPGEKSVNRNALAMAI